VRSRNTFGARTSHGLTWTHKTHRGSNLGEATTFPFIVYFVPSHGPTLKFHFVPGLPGVNPEIPKVETLVTLRPITLYVDLWLKWGLKQSCSLCWELFNNMFHTTCTQGNWGNYQLLVVGVKLSIWLSALLLAIICVWSVQIGNVSPF
jgi:hypothetical protein